MKRFLLGIFLIAACTPQNDKVVNGYIEGEYVYISPYASGILDEINVVKGQNIKKGEKLFAVDFDIWNANIEKAKNEINAAQEQQKQAEALLVNYQKEYERARKLVKNNTVSQAHYDARLADFENAKAKTAELAAQRESAEQNFLQVTKQYSKNIALSSVSGIVDDVYFRLGEYVPAGTPILTILPPENVKIRFFVPEKILPRLSQNMPVWVECDGCSQKIPAKISFISSKAEFTPPVIYSVESREKLVFMIEAEFDDKTQNLHPGLPVSVRIENDDRTVH